MEGWIFRIGRKQGSFGDCLGISRIQACTEQIARSGNHLCWPLEQLIGVKAAHVRISTQQTIEPPYHRVPQCSSFLCNGEAADLTDEWVAMQRDSRGYSLDPALVARSAQHRRAIILQRQVEPDRGLPRISLGDRLGKQADRHVTLHDHRRTRRKTLPKHSQGERQECVLTRRKRSLNTRPGAYANLAKMGRLADHEIAGLVQRSRKQS